MKLIPLSKNGRKHKGKYFAMVDDEDYKRVNWLDWHVENPTHRSFYPRARILGKHIVPMHRMILKVPEGLMVDHIDGDGLNNQKHNLRICTHAENMRNKRRHNEVRPSNGKKYISQYKGVRKTGKKWHGVITLNKKRIYSPTFNTEVEAALWYNESATRLHGEFAALNQIAV